jgi:hypothetical protein
MEAKKKYTFKEFIAALHSREFDEIQPHCIESTKSFIQKINDLDFIHSESSIKDKTIDGCDLCKLQNYLEEYRLYYFDEPYYRKEYLGE